MMDLYRLFQVEPSATAAELKTAWRALARREHPDLSKHPLAEERFKFVGAAYRMLSNPEERRQYDEQRNAEAARARLRAQMLSRAQTPFGGNRWYTASGATATFHQGPGITITITTF